MAPSNFAESSEAVVACAAIEQFGANAEKQIVAKVQDLTRENVGYVNLRNRIVLLTVFEDQKTYWDPSP
jgi:hypothetical protein